MYGTRGYIPWYSEDDNMILIPCYYCREVKETIISPTDIVQYHIDKYSGWIMRADVDRKMGEFQLIA